jgi:ABC-type Fe3+-siderophore transport system permease subunit
VTAVWLEFIQRVNRKPFIDSSFINVSILSTAVAVAGILGNIVGYWFGSKRYYLIINNFLCSRKISCAIQRFFDKEELIFCQILTYI